MRLQHAVMASTFLQAARQMCSDEELELHSGYDLERLARGLDKQIEDAMLKCTKR